MRFCVVVLALFLASALDAVAADCKIVRV